MQQPNDLRKGIFGFGLHLTLLIKDASTHVGNIGKHSFVGVFAYWVNDISKSIIVIG